jgi:hypothetical protein
MSGKGIPRYKKLAIDGNNGSISIYASPRILKALSEATIELDFYQGVKLSEVMTAVYLQGKKDGRREVRAMLDDSLGVIDKKLPSRLPGQPKKKKRSKRTEESS